MNKTPTQLNSIIEGTNFKAQYDQSCKKILANKEITARILKGVVSEYKDCTIPEIISYISDIEVGEAPVDTDTIPPSVALENNEDIALNEGVRSYDLKFTSAAPGDDGKKISLIINIEAQRKFNPGYSLVKRGIYYCCRLISSEYGTVFYKSDYDKLQKVYSIWICTNPNDAHRNTVTQYSMSEKMLYGSDVNEKQENYDILSLIMVCLDSENISSDNSLLELLSTIFSSQLAAREKKEILEKKFSIPMNTEINEEVEAMCNLSENIYEQGMEKGIEKGEEKLLRQIIQSKIRSNASDDDIYNELKEFGASKELIEKIRSEMNTLA